MVLILAQGCFVLGDFSPACSKYVANQVRYFRGSRGIPWRTFLTARAKRVPPPGRPERPPNAHYAPRLHRPLNRPLGKAVPPPRQSLKSRRCSSARGVSTLAGHFRYLAGSGLGACVARAACRMGLLTGFGRFGRVSGSYIERLREIGSEIASDATLSASQRELALPTRRGGCFERSTGR